MKLLVDRPQVFPIDVRVDLGRGEVGVTQHLLHGAEVGATLEKVSREGVAKRVRSDPLDDSRALGGALDDSPRPHPRQGLPARIEEEPSSSLSPIQVGRMVCR